jgi:hypothetical protein
VPGQEGLYDNAVGEFFSAICCKFAPAVALRMDAGGVGLRRDQQLATLWRYLGGNRKLFKGRLLRDQME